MPITLMTPPTGGIPVTTDDYGNNVAIQQQLVNNLSKNTYGLTEWYTLTEPEISLGTNIQHGGSFYVVDTADESIAGAPADGRVYIKLTAGVGVLTASFVTSLAGYSWDDIYQGFYHADGSQILPIILIKYNSTSWLKFNFFDYRDQKQESMADVVLLPAANTVDILNDDYVEGIPQPASTVFFPFCNPCLENSSGVIPKLISNANWKDYNDSEAKYSDRGLYHLDDGAVVYDYAWGNEGYIKLRIQPNFEFDVAANVYFIDSRSGITYALDRIILIYSFSDDKIVFYIDDDAGNYIRIWSDVFLSTVALNVPMDIVITWTKSGNNANMFINGVEMDGVGAGTKTTLGTGIGSINIVGTDICFGSVNSTTTKAPGKTANMYILDCIAGNTYSANTTNYDGTGTTKPQYEDDWLVLKNHSGMLKGTGAVGFKSIDCDKINNGGGYYAEKVIKIGSWNMNSSAAGLTSKFVSHGLSATERLTAFIVDVMIYNDAGTGRKPLNSISTISGNPNGTAFDIDATAIYLFAFTGELFDTNLYDDTTINRGEILLKYIKD